MVYTITNQGKHSLWLPLIGSLLVAALGLWEAINNENYRTSKEQAKAASQIAHSLQGAVEKDSLILAAIKSFYLSSEYVSREEFKEFVSSFLELVPGIQAVEWIPRVKKEERIKFEQKAREDGFKKFQFKERGQHGQLVPRRTQEEYFPVYYVEPLRSNRKLLGFDLASNPTRFKALEQARDSGKSVASAKLTLAQEQGIKNGFLIFHPVYQKKSLGNSIASRRKTLMGFVLGVFRIGDLIKATRQKINTENIEFALFDRTDPSQTELLFASSPTKADRNNIITSKTLKTGQRTWELIFWPSASFLAEKRAWLINAVLIDLLIFVVLASIFYWGARIFTHNFFSIGINTGTGLLREVVHELKQTSEEQLSSSGEQKTAIEEANRTLGELVFATEAIAKSVTEVSKLADSAVSQCEKGKVSALKEQDRANKFTSRVGDVLNHIDDLQARSQEIHLAVEIISELAEQTTILSYNAMIEASSAGEAGQSFAVVAKHVGTLARRAKESSKLVRELIQDIENSTKKVMSVTQQTLDETEIGLESQKDMTDVVLKISEEVRNTLEATKVIEESIKIQFHSADDVQIKMSHLLETASQLHEHSAQLFQSAERIASVSQGLQSI